MFKQLFASMASSPVMSLPLISLCLIFVVFVAVTVRVMLDRSAQMDRMANLPLEGDGDPHE